MWEILLQHFIFSWILQLLKMKHLYSQKLHFQTYLPNSCKKVSFHQELLVLFWKMCDQNKVKCVFQMIIAPYSLRAMWPSDHAPLIIAFFSLFYRNSCFMSSRAAMYWIFWFPFFITWMMPDLTSVRMPLSSFYHIYDWHTKYIKSSLISWIGQHLHNTMYIRLKKLLGLTGSLQL